MNNALHEQWKELEALRTVAPGNGDPEAPRVGTTRSEQSAAIRRRLINAAKAVEWLEGLGVEVVDGKATRFCAVVRVVHTPLLRRLFGDNCAWRQQRQVGDATVLTWFAVRYGARIEWEERQCVRG